MSYADCHLDPSTTDSVSTLAQGPKATLGGLYTYHTIGGGAPSGLYRYVQIADLTIADGDVLCPDTETLEVCSVASGDRSADVISTSCIGIGVVACIATSYCYILVRGRHQAIRTDAGVAAGDALSVGSSDFEADTRAETVAAMTFGTALEADSSAGYCSADVSCL